MCEQQLIQFDSIERKATPTDNRKIGVAFVCFEDQIMNFSSDLKFSTTTKNWRNLQQALALGDYGGSFDPQSILNSLDEIDFQVNCAALNCHDSIDEIIFKKYKVENGVKLLNSLRKISEVAMHAGTNVRVMTAKFLCTHDSLDVQ